MNEATLSVLQALQLAISKPAPVRPHMNPIVVSWAKMEARKAVKRELTDKNVKVAYVPARTINLAANEYL